MPRIAEGVATILKTDTLGYYGDDVSVVRMNGTTEADFQWRLWLTWLMLCRLLPMGQSAFAERPVF